MSKSKPTGLPGIDAFTKGARPALTKPAETEVATELEEPKKEPEKPKIVKERTTVMLYPETLSAMEQLKVELRKSGEKVTYSDVLEQAIWALMEKKGLKP